MPLDLQSLSTDTLLYMLMHSGVFVAIMGAVFFVIGLLFGYATWGRYKTHARRLAGEIDQQLEELATLKRKLGDQAVKPGSVSIATETIAMPPVEASMPVQVPEAHAPLPPPSPSLPAEIITDTLTTEEPPATPAATVKTKTTRTKTSLKAKPAATSEAISGASALASIIAPHAAPSEPKPDSAPAQTLASAVEALDIIPAFPELPAAPQPVEIKPELDAKLGLVYKTPPTKPDDLTKMKGIARVLEQRLHEFGIYTYEQIASWTEDQIKELSSRLAFKDRIHREKWVEQAKRLHEEKQKAA